jgi:hypothetical protein
MNGRFRAQDMKFRAVSHAGLSLLVALVQLTAATGMPGAQPADTGAEYFCCCIGECHCTADCCNHAPSESSVEFPGTVRMGGGGQVLEAPRSCGLTQGTLQRPSQEHKSLAFDLRSGSRLEIDSKRFRLESPTIPAFNDATPGPASPRGPPTHPSRA